MRMIYCPMCRRPLSPAALSCPGCGHPMPALGDRSFQTWLRYRRKVLLAICIAAVPVGVVLEQPLVWVLGLLGIAVVAVRLWR